MVTQPDLPFEMPRFERNVPHFGRIRTQVWSEQKAKLIARYLQLFVYITHHGTYIDGFSGPQYPDKTDAWTAKRVLETEPRWLRDFFLCEKDPQKLVALNALVAEQPQIRHRHATVLAGDFNVRVGDILASDRVAERIATFCLLDQHTFECEWRTVEEIAAAKEVDKVEQMYFVPTGWYGRAAAAQADKSVIERWWGRSDWASLQPMTGHLRAEAFCERFRSHLGYAFVYAWPIFAHEGGRGRLMYHLIHASDHPAAPLLMARAYRTATKSLPPEEQLVMELDALKRDLGVT